MNGWTFSEQGWIGRFFSFMNQSLPKSSCDLIWRTLKMLAITAIVMAGAYLFLSLYFHGLFDVLFGGLFTPYGAFFFVVTSLTIAGIGAYLVHEALYRRNWQLAKAYFTANPDRVPKHENWTWDYAKQDAEHRWSREEMIVVWKQCLSEDRKNTDLPPSVVDTVFDGFVSFGNVIRDIWKSITGKVCIPITWTSAEDK